MTATRPLTHLIQGIIIEVWQSLSKSRSEKSMDHSHHDRTYKKSRVQQELEQSVSRKLISSLLLGCLLFCIAIAAVNALNQNARREDHLESVAATFHEVYNNTSAFLLDAGHTELLLTFRNSSTTRNGTSTRSFKKSLAQRLLTTSTAAVFRTLWNSSGKENCPSPKSAGSAALVSTNILTTFSKNT